LRVGEAARAGDRPSLNGDTPGVDDLAQLLDVLTGTSWDDDLVAYRCSNCGERCINPQESRLVDARVCLGCHLDYLSDRVRAVRRREIDG
jgi:hypothetical protein